MMCNGKLDHAPKHFPKVNLPILACNTDLVWMAEASMPRFGHGAFLHCLEQIYQKLSGNELKYSYIVGKPSEITYIYAENLINQFARRIGINKKIKRLYAIG
jgi:ribonucleotide monophosphatase NagD (HAD superfamily)